MTVRKSDPQSDPIETAPAAVQRWALAGGEWNLLHADDARAVVELRQCDGGTVAEVLTLTTSEDIHWARQQLTSN